MYKKQMTFQRIVCLALLFGCAIMFVYSLGLMTDVYDCIGQTYLFGKPRYENTSIYADMQEFNRNLTVMSIVLLLIGLFNFMMGTNSRRRYYIGNYFAIMLSVICNIGVSIWGIAQIVSFRETYVNTNFETIQERLELTHQMDNFTQSTFWFDACYLVFGIMIIISILLIVNMVLKIMLMNEEKRLIGSRKDVRA